MDDTSVPCSPNLGKGVDVVFSCGLQLPLKSCDSHGERDISQQDLQLCQG